MALRSCAVPGSQRPRHTVGPVHKKRPDMWPWSRPCTPRLGPRGRPTPQPWAGVSQRGHLHDDCRGAGRVEPGRSSSSLWASPCASGHVPATDRNPEAILHGACHPESGQGFAASGRPGGLGPQPQHPSQLCASENGLPARGQPHLHADSPQAFTLPPASPAAVGKPPPDKALPGLFPGEQVPLGWGPGGGEGLLCNSACALPAPRLRPAAHTLGLWSRLFLQGCGPRPSPLSVLDSASISKGSAERLSHRWHLQESPWRWG